MITFEEYSRWFNSALLDRPTCGALAARMGLRLFPFFAGKVSDAQDNQKSSAYLELVSSTLCVLAAARAATKHPTHILRSQIADAEKWFGRGSTIFSSQNAKAREVAGSVAATAAVAKAEAEKGEPLTFQERQQVYFNANRNAVIGFDPGQAAVSSAASTIGFVLRVFTSHEVSARDMARNALVTISTACQYPGGGMCGSKFQEASGAFLAALEADVQGVKSGRDASSLSDSPLWPAGEPEWAVANWAALRDGLSQSPGWSIWSRWYGERRTGTISEHTSEIIFIGNPEAIWKEGESAWAAYLQKSLASTINDAAAVASEEEQLQSEARSAILLRRTDLPVSLDHPALSYLGGLPKLPPDLEWPKAEVRADVEEETVALTFLAQIDLAELPQFEGRAPLPAKGMLFFFGSSVFEGEGEPPCRVLYHRESAAAFPQRKPPPDLMPLAGEGGDYQAKWLQKKTDFHASVEFKYPVSFLTYKDFGFKNDSVGGELLVKSLCKALGPGVPEDTVLRQPRNADAFAKDEDWPFNWSLVTLVIRAVISRIESDLRPNPYRKPQNDETRQALLSLLTAAQAWRDDAAAHPPFESPNPSLRESFRGWWANVVSTYKGLKGDVLTYDFQFPDDVQKTITHNIKLLAEQGEKALAQAPSKYVDNFMRRNHWTTPRPEAGRYRFFSMAIHQMLGHGKSVQNAPVEHLDDVLLLQLHGDDAFFPWHDNCGCVLQLWIEKNALLILDFSGVQATLECD